MIHAQLSFPFQVKDSGIVRSIVNFHEVCAGLSDNAHLHMFAEILSHDAARYGSWARLANSS